MEYSDEKFFDKWFKTKKPEEQDPMIMKTCPECFVCFYGFLSNKLEKCSRCRKD